MRNLLISLILVLLNTSMVAGKNLEEIIKNSPLMHCENESYFSSIFPDTIGILNYKNFLLFIDFNVILNNRFKFKPIPDEVYKNSIIIKILHGSIFTGYGTKVSKDKEGYSPSTNLDKPYTWRKFSWWHDETSGMPQWNTKNPEKGFIKPYIYDTRPIGLPNDKFSFYLVNVDGVNKIDEEFTCRLPHSSFKSIPIE